MSAQITKLTVYKLWGSVDVSIPVYDNRLVLVGINGLGKSTIANFLYLLLSRQWSRLADVEFDSFDLETTDGSISLTRQTIEQELRSHRESSRTHPVVRRNIDNLQRQGMLEAFVEATESELGRFAEIVDIGPEYLRRLQIDIKGFLNYDTAPSQAKVASKTIKQLLGEDQLLYLPTYRRIEKDLKVLVPDIEERRRYKDNLRTDAYSEVIQFGMEDVKERISATLAELNDNNRKELNALAGSYLRDVIRGRGSEYGHDELLQLNHESVTDILRRVEENALDNQEKTLLKEALERLKNGTQNQSDAYVAHFLSKLVQSAKKLAVREQPVSDFVAVCNRYLEGKQLVYDGLQYRVSVKTTLNTELELKQLSSGEKQIVSLLAQVYLSKSDLYYFMIIDEPELSLSIPWQQALLPDLWKSNHCRFIMAVTHSPFIFDNEMRPFVVDMKECLSVK